jgi:hypothetical protein
MVAPVEQGLAEARPFPFLPTVSEIDASVELYRRLSRRLDE